jgi:hypothetical protein
VHHQVRWSRIVPYLAVLVLAAGCGTPPAIATASPSPLQLADTAAACLRQHGLAVPDPTLGSNGRPQWDYRALGGAPQATLQAAVQACRSQLTAAHVPGIAANAAANAAGVKYAQCMRQHGLPAFPDPDPANGTFTGASSLSGHGIDTGSPLFRTANQACRSELAQWHAAIGAGG